MLVQVGLYVRIDIHPRFYLAVRAVVGYFRTLIAALVFN